MVGRAWHPVRMDRWIDLDQVAGLISSYAVAWEQAGLAVGALTWRDVGVPWPYPLKADRGEVVDADSVGVAVGKLEQEDRLVVFRGGAQEVQDRAAIGHRRRVHPPGAGVLAEELPAGGVVVGDEQPLGREEVA